MATNSTLYCRRQIKLIGVLTMSTIIVPQNIDAETDSAKLYLPVTDGLQYIMLGTDSVKKATHNFAPRKRDGQGIGAVSIVDNVAKFVSQSAYLQTDVAETADFTAIFVVKTDDTLAASATRAVVFGTFESLPKNGETTKTYGSIVYFNSATQISLIAGRGTTVANTLNGNVVLTTNPKQYQLYVARVDATTNMIKNITAATINTKNDATVRMTTIANYRIGSSYAAFNGHCQLPFVALYNRALTDVEVDSVAKTVRRIMLKKGITI